MRRHRVSKGIVSGTMEMNEAAVKSWQERGYTVTDIGPSLMIIVDEGTGIPLDWQHVGYAAFHRGDAAIPALDRHVTDALEKLNPGIGTVASRIFSQWLVGWHTANAAAPVPGIASATR